MTPANDNTPTRPQWFDDLLVKYHPHIAKQCAKRCPDGAEDLYQDSVLRAMERWKQYREGPDGGFAVWIVYIIRSVMRDRERSKTIKMIDVPVPDMAVECTQHFRAEIGEAMSRLNSHEAEAVRMAAAGYIGPEIGAAVGLTKQGAWYRIERARAKLVGGNDNRKQDAAA